MASLNKILLIGNVGKDAELKYLANGTGKAEFSLAVNHRMKQGDEWKDQTEWFNVVLFGETAEKLGEHITKGKQLYLEGRIQTRSWEHEGQKHYRTEVIANSVQFLGKREDDGWGDGAKPVRKGKEKVDDELPF